MGFLRIIFASSFLLGIFSFGYANARNISSDEMRKVNESMIFLKIAGFDLKTALVIKKSLIDALKSSGKVDDATVVGVKPDKTKVTVGDIKGTAKESAKTKEKEDELKKVANQYIQAKKNENKDGRGVFPYLFKQGNKLCKEIKILGGKIPTIPILNADGSTTDKPICT